MSFQNTFERYEIKYLITKKQQAVIKDAMSLHICPDKYGKSTICNIYFDTASSLLIRRSMEKPVYKEKLRVRSYGTASHDQTVFVELKKKYMDVVYKRRVCMSERDSMNYLARNLPLKSDSQIINEIDYFKELYGILIPKIFLSYEREAFYDKDDDNLRITFDKNILWREDHLSLYDGVYGMPLMPENNLLMEIKTSAAIPLWLSHILSENQIYKTSFSKYANAYLASLTLKGAAIYA